MKDLEVCEVYDLLFISGAETISFYTPLQMLGSLLSWDVKGIFVPLLINISSHQQGQQGLTRKKSSHKESLIFSQTAK